MKILVSALAFFLWVISTEEALAKGHSRLHRELTLAELSDNVGKECGPVYLSWTRCGQLNNLLRDLYKDPNIATNADLVILQKMEDLGVAVAGAKSDLAQAIAHAQNVFQHVVSAHDGKWDDGEICLPVKS